MRSNKKIEPKEVCPLCWKLYEKEYPNEYGDYKEFPICEDCNEEYLIDYDPPRYNLLWALHSIAQLLHPQKGDVDKIGHYDFEMMAKSKIVFEIISGIKPFLKH